MVLLFPVLCQFAENLMVCNTCSTLKDTHTLASQIKKKNNDSEVYQKCFQKLIRVTTV